MTLFQAITRILFGYDAFISYPRADGEQVAVALDAALRGHRYVSFLDRHEGLYGTDLKATLRSRLARSQALVIVATPASFASPHVQFEVSTFAERVRSKPRPIIVVGTRETRTACPWDVLREVVWIDDFDPSAVDAGQIGSLVDKIEQRLIATRRELLLRNALALSASVFLLVAAVATWQWIEAARQRDRALALRLASRSELLREEQADRIETAALLAAESALRNPNEQFESGRALVDALDLLARQPRQQLLPANARLLRFTDDGRDLVAVLADDTIRVAGLDGAVLWQRGGARDVASLESATTAAVVTIDRRGATTEWSSSGSRPGRSDSFPPGTVLSGDGRYALAPTPGGDRASMLIDVMTRANLMPVIGLDLADITVLQVSPEPEHRYVLLGTQRRRSAFLVDRRTKAKTSLEPGNVIDQATFSADGGLVALGGRNFEATVFDVVGSNRARVRHQHFIRSLVFSPDGRHLLTSSFDRTVRMISTVSGIEELRVPHAEEIDGIAFSPRQDSFATAAGRNVRVFPARPGHEWPTLPVDLRAVSVLAKTAATQSGAGTVPLLVPLTALGGDRLALVNVQAGEVAQFDAASGTRTGRWPLTAKPAALAMDPSGNDVFVATADGGGWITAGDAMERIVDLSSLGGVMAAAISSDWIVAGGANGAKAYSRAGRETCDLTRTTNIRAVALSTESKTAFLGGDRSVEVADLSTCRKLFDVPQPDAVLAVAATSDGRLLAAGTADTPVVRVYRLETTSARELLAIKRQGAVRTMAFSPRGDRLAVGAEDRTTRLYNASDGVEVGRAKFMISPFSVAFSRDGSVLRSVTGQDEGSGTALVIAHRTLAVSSMLAEICHRIAAQALTSAEWSAYLPGATYRRTCDAVRAAGSG